LSERGRSALEPFVERRMAESKERILVDWDDEQIKERLAEVLFEDYPESAPFGNLNYLFSTTIGTRR
jgi:hypothetical protein